MASVKDFLFQGTPPPSVNSYGTTTTQVPQWLSDYVQGTLNKANQLAAQPYQTYKGQRVAKPNGDMQAGWNMAKDAATAYQPYFQSAQATLNNSGAGTALQTAQPYLNQATSLNAVGAAQPYFNQAGQSSAGLVSGYLSPYQNAVVDQIGRKGQETLQSNLHTLGDDFIRAGGMGGTRHMGVAGKAATDMTNAVTDAQGQLLNQGYQTALGAAQNDLARYADIGQAQGNLTLGQQQNMGALAQMAGNFSSIDTRNKMDQATNYASLGKAAQQAGLTGAAAVESVGNTQRGLQQANLDLAYQDFQNQKNYPYQMTDWMRGQTTGMPNMGGTVYTDSNAPLSGSTYGPSGLGQIVGGLSLMNSFGSLFKADGGYVDADELPSPKRRRKHQNHGYHDYAEAC